VADEDKINDYTSKAAELLNVFNSL